MIKRYKELLERHDWHFERADDNYSWNQGRLERRAIIDTEKAMLEEGFTLKQVEELWNNECPELLKRENGEYIALKGL